MNTAREGYAPLPAYAARATWLHKLVYEDVNATNRADVVHSTAGPQGVPIHFRADGILIFDFQHSPLYAGGAIPSFNVSTSGDVPSSTLKLMQERDAIRERRYRYMNAYLSCFNSAVAFSNQLSRASGPDHYIWARKEGGQWILRDNGGANLQSIPFALTVPQADLSKSITIFNSGTYNDFELTLDILALFYRLAYHQSNHEPQTSLILAWTVIERCQNVLWHQFVTGGYKAVNPHSNITGQRKRILLNDRNYTASIKSQILALCGVYQDSELASLDAVRKKRNDFMHGFEGIESSDSMAAMWALTNVIEKALGVALRPFGSPGSWDYIR